LIVQTTVAIDSSLHLFTFTSHNRMANLTNESYCYISWTAVQLLKKESAPLSYSQHTRNFGGWFHIRFHTFGCHVLCFCIAVSCRCSGWHSTCVGFDPDCSRHAAALPVSVSFCHSRVRTRCYFATLYQLLRLTVSAHLRCTREGQMIDIKPHLPCRPRYVPH
jgi:hypothetical protein